MPPACNKMAGRRHNLRLLGFNDGHGPFHAAAARATGIIGPRLERIFIDRNSPKDTAS
jgi:hypothetical protein